MKNRPLLLAFLAAVCVHVIAGLLLSFFLVTHNRIVPRSPQVSVSLELAERPKPAAGQTANKAVAAASEKPPGGGLTHGSGQTAEETGRDLGPIPEEPLGENPTPGSGQTAEQSGETPAGVTSGTSGDQGSSQPSLAGGEPPYLIDTPPRFLEKGPISFPGESGNLAARTSIIVYLSLSAKAEILSIDAVAQGVDALKVEVIKMILKSKLSPAYVGKMPVPCVAKCVVNIVRREVD